MHPNLEIHELAEKVFFFLPAIIHRLRFYFLNRIRSIIAFQVGIMKHQQKPFIDEMAPSPSSIGSYHEAARGERERESTTVCLCLSHICNSTKFKQSLYNAPTESAKGDSSWQEAAGDGG